MVAWDRLNSAASPRYEKLHRSRGAATDLNRTTQTLGFLSHSHHGDTTSVAVRCGEPARILCDPRPVQVPQPSHAQWPAQGRRLELIGIQRATEPEANHVGLPCRRRHEATRNRFGRPRDVLCDDRLGSLLPPVVLLPRRYGEQNRYRCSYMK